MTNYTYHRGKTSKDIYLMDWHVAPAKFYQVNGALLEWQTITAPFYLQVLA